MSNKADFKKKYILDKSRKIFAVKGFKMVTMKDIVEACDISRGGLYLYFDSTETLFDELIKYEISKSDKGIEKAISSVVTMTDILTIYIREQKREILSANDSLAVAIYEYCFYKKENKKEVIEENKEEVIEENEKEVIEENKEEVIEGNKELEKNEFINKQDNRTYIDLQMHNSINFLEKLFKTGTDEKEFWVENPKLTARNMVYAFEAMKLINRAGAISEKAVDDEISYLLRDIVMPDCDN